MDQKVPAQYFRARILWLQGHVDQAQALVRTTVQDGEALEHALLFANVLGQAACPIAWLVGDLDTAKRYWSVLSDQTEHNGLQLWRGWARAGRQEPLAAIHKGFSEGIMTEHFMKASQLLATL